MRIASIGRADVDGIGVRIGEHRDALEPELPARSNDANGNLAAIGDQDAFHFGFRFHETLSRRACPPVPRRTRAGRAMLLVVMPITSPGFAPAT